MLDEIIVRKMPFDFPTDIDAVFVDGDHKRSFNFIAGSLLLPHLEPYLIRSMKDAEKYVTDPVVAEGLDKFVRQEAQHYQMHKKFNDTVRLAGFPELASFEKELSDDYHRFTNTKSLKFNLVRIWERTISCGLTTFTAGRIQTHDHKMPVPGGGVWHSFLTGDQKYAQGDAASC